MVDKYGLHYLEKKWLNNYSERQLRVAVILNKNNELVGTFFYYQFQKAAFKFIIPPPFTPHISLFYLNPATSIVGKHSFDKDILSLIADYFKNIGVHYVKLNLPESIIDTQAFLWKGYQSVNRYTYLLDLSKSEDELLANLSSEKRKSISKAQKDELEIKEIIEHKEIVYDLIVKSLSRHDIAKNLSVIKSIILNYSDSSNSFAFVAYHQGKPAASSFCVYNKERAIYMFGGFDEQYKHHGAGVSCMWNSILKAKQLGLTYFDFEGSMNPDIERYFREFGGRLVPVYEVEFAKFPVKQLMRLKK